MTADVSVVVVTFNALPWIERCLESVSGNEVIVVDHGSTDGTLALVLERFPEARLIEQENRGMGGGNNAGMRVAQGRFAFLLNSDAWSWTTRSSGSSPTRTPTPASPSSGPG